MTKNNTFRHAQKLIIEARLSKAGRGKRVYVTYRKFSIVSIISSLLMFWGWLVWLPKPIRASYTKSIRAIVTTVIFIQIIIVTIIFISSTGRVAL